MLASQARYLIIVHVLSIWSHISVLYSILQNEHVTVKCWLRYNDHLVALMK